MILADTSVWIDHLRRRNDEFAQMLTDGRILVHSLVIGELALGNLKPREVVLKSLRDMTFAMQAGDEEVMQFIDEHRLHGRGIGFVDAHLLASARLSSAKFFTRDRKLLAIAVALGLAYAEHQR